MKIAIMVAMEKELALLLPLLRDAATTTINKITYHTGKIHDRKVVVCQCGIGKVNAAVSALTMIENFHPALLINTGVAGGTGAAGILDVVIGAPVAYHDVWCGPGTVEGQAAGCPRVFECPLPAEVIDSLGDNVRAGLIATGDVFVSDPDVLRRILTVHPDAMAVDMESAAIAQVCHIKDVPFISLRVISDTPGDDTDNISQYENFWSDAPRNAFRVVEALIEKL